MVPPKNILVMSEEENRKQRCGAPRKQHSIPVVHTVCEWGISIKVSLLKLRNLEFLQATFSILTDLPYFLSVDVWPQQGSSPFWIEQRGACVFYQAIPIYRPYHREGDKIIYAQRLL